MGNNGIVIGDKVFIKPLYVPAMVIDIQQGFYRLDDECYTDVHKSGHFYPPELLEKINKNEYAKNKAVL